MAIKVLLWDSDGCLVDSLKVSMQNFVDSVKDDLNSSDLPPYLEIFEKYLGAREESDVLNMATSKGIPKNKHDSIQKKFIKLKQGNLLRIKLFKGIRGVLVSSRKKGCIRL